MRLARLAGAPLAAVGQAVVAVVAVEPVAAVDPVAAAVVVLTQLARTTGSHMRQ